jgi:hypothetical protein
LLGRALLQRGCAAKRQSNCAGSGARRQAYLQKAVAERSSRVVEMKYEPAFAGLRGEPPFN